MKKIYIVAVVAALISAVLLYSFLNSYDKKSAKNEKVNYKTEDVVVALEDIPANTTVTDKMVTVIKMPVDGIHPDAAKQRVDVVGLIATTDIVADEQLIKSKFLSGSDSGNDLAYQVAQGKRAMAIEVDSAAGVAGYVEVGDLVDVIAVVDSPTKQFVKTARGEKMEIDGRVTTVVAEAAKVLRVGDVGYVTSPLDVYTSLTLELSPEQCAKIATARDMGKLTVTLRYKSNNRTLNIGPFSSSDALK